MTTSRLFRTGPSGWFVWALRRRSTQRLLAAVLLAFLTMPAQAFNVYNNTFSTLKVEVYEGDFSPTLNPGEVGSCNYSNTDCNPTGSQTAVLTLQVETQNTDDRNWLCVVDMEAGGWAEIYEVFGFGLYVNVYNANGTFRKSNAYGAKKRNRDVRFLVSADCQYIASGTTSTSVKGGGGNGIADQVNAQMISDLNSNDRIRGILYAGDLTQNAWTQGTDSDGNDDDEFQWYQDSINGQKRFFFDGLGNHDVEETGDIIKSNPNVIANEIRDRKRNTQKAAFDGTRPHYAWFWHDVLFIQANLFPGDSASANFPHNPDKALQFIKDTLPAAIGPVVIIHHYGFDDFSTGNGGPCDDVPDSNGNFDEPWWTESERVAYWNAIKGYNVVAIFTGHLHLTPSSTCPWRIDWFRPSGATSGPEFIPTFVSGAARDGIYLDVEINNANQIHVTRREQDGSVNAEECATFQEPVYVTPEYLLSPTSPRNYGWSIAPWTTMQDVAVALNQSARYPTTDFRGLPLCDQNEVQVNITTGYYPGGATLNSKVSLNPINGPIFLGVDVP